MKENNIVQKVVSRLEFWTESVTKDYTTASLESITDNKTHLTVKRILVVNERTETTTAAKSKQ